MYRLFLFAKDTPGGYFKFIHFFEIYGIMYESKKIIAKKSELKSEYMKKYTKHLIFTLR